MGEDFVSEDRYSIDEVLTNESLPLDCAWHLCM